MFAHKSGACSHVFSFPPNVAIQQQQLSSHQPMPQAHQANANQLFQARYWLLTIPYQHFVPWLPPGICYIKGQLEQGGNTGYLHWQLLVVFDRKVRLGGVQKVFGTELHAEPSRSEAADEYVWKDDTAVLGTRFELGAKPFKRNSKVDWERVRSLAKDGRIESIDASTYVRHYNTLKRIAKDHATAPVRVNVRVNVYWGVTGSGKSHRAHQEAGEAFYAKGATTKWWDGYKGEDRVIIDEFRGQVSIEHLLRWFDKWPCYVEEKGGQLPLLADKFWVCSNLHPNDWYPNTDEETKNALLRRLTITEFAFPYVHQNQNQ